MCYCPLRFCRSREYGCFRSGRVRAADTNYGFPYRGQSSRGLFFRARNRWRGCFFGASRLVSDGKLQGNTEYVATVISEATGGDLFEIKTVHTYPGTHKELIDAAKKESDEDARPALATHIKNLNEYDVVFVGFPNWWYDMPQPLYTFLTSMISVARPSFRSARMAAAVSRMLSRLSARWRKGRPSLMAMPLPATV